MAPRPPSSDDQKTAAAGDPVAPELDRKLVADKAAKPSERDGLEIEDDEDDEDLVVYTAQEAAGAFAILRDS